MSQPARTLQDVNQEYARQCMNAGQIQYQISELSKDLGLTNNRLRELNMEAFKFKEAEAIAKNAVAKAAAEAKSEAEKEEPKQKESA